MKILKIEHKTIAKLKKHTNIRHQFKVSNASQSAHSTGQAMAGEHLCDPHGGLSDSLRLCIATAF